MSYKPQSLFRLISKHLLLDEVSRDPGKLIFDLNGYTAFRDKRFARMKEILTATVNPEISTGSACR